MQAHPERARAARGAGRAGWLPCAARRAAERKVAIVLFNFPPNAGTPAPPPTSRSSPRSTHPAGACGPPATRSRCRTTSTRCARRILGGNAARFGADANVHARIPRRRPCPPRAAGSPRSRPSGARPPGASRATAARLHARRAVRQRLVGVQPAFGYEGDPMRLLFEKGFAPTHAFSAFYRYLREDFAPTPCCISAPTVRSSSCPASSPAFPPPAGPTG